MNEKLLKKNAKVVDEAIESAVNDIALIAERARRDVQTARDAHTKLATLTRATANIVAVTNSMTTTALSAMLSTTEELINLTEAPDLTTDIVNGHK